MAHVRLARGPNPQNSGEFREFGPVGLCFDTRPVVLPSSGRIAVPLWKVRDIESILRRQLIRPLTRSSQFILLTSADDVRHDGNGVLRGSVVGAIGRLDRRGERVPRGIDADGHISLEIAAEAHAGIPSIELGYGEIVELLGDGEAGVAWLD